METVSARAWRGTIGRVAAALSGERLRLCRKGPTLRRARSRDAGQISAPGPLAAAGSLLSGRSARINVPLPGVDSITI
jgi:hypothetical protein